MANNVEDSKEAYCMLAALCAEAMIQANVTVPANFLPTQGMAQMSNAELGHKLLRESVRVRRGIDYLENPTDLSVLTSWLYYGCYLGLGKEQTAWSYLREATTQALLLHMDDEESYRQDPLNSWEKRILYWVLFIAERYVSNHAAFSLCCILHLTNNLTQDTCAP
jgi:hypothetical protein